MQTVVEDNVGPIDLCLIVLEIPIFRDFNMVDDLNSEKRKQGNGLNRGQSSVEWVDSFREKKQIGKASNRIY